ncbi:hypothetical protein D3C75_821530 [compost metagenome]
MLYIVAMNLVKYDIIVHQITFLMLITWQPIISANMTLWGDEDNIYAQLQPNLLQTICEYAWSLSFCELNFTHNKSYFTHVLHPSFLFRE